jgi:hypothetical protein
MKKYKGYTYTRIAPGIVAIYGEDKTNAESYCITEKDAKLIIDFLAHKATIAAEES